MAIQQHYDNFLAKYYSWMFGDYEAKVRENIDFFQKHQMTPQLGKQAIDLGCGSGFQSLALADLGFEVVSIDLSNVLLDELNWRRGNKEIKTVHSDILDFQDYCCNGDIGVITCMGDTLTHLESQDKVWELFQQTYESLKSNGVLCLTFRDMTTELKGLDRIIPVRSDERTVMTCFLEYESNFVNVNDIVYSKTESGWELSKSNYKKLRISGEWTVRKLEECGFKIRTNIIDKSFVKIVALK